MSVINHGCIFILNLFVNKVCIGHCWYWSTVSFNYIPNSKAGEAIERTLMIDFTDVESIFQW